MRMRVSDREALEHTYAMRANLKQRTRLFAKDLARYFKGLTDEQLELLADYLNKNPDITFKGITGPEAEAILFARDKWDRELKKVAKPHIDDIFSASLKALNKDLGSQVIIATDPKIVTLGARILGGLIKVNEYTQDRMKAVIIEEVSHGRTVQEVQEAIQERVGSPQDRRGVGGFARSLRIARTETGFASSTSRYLGMQEAGVSRHTWITGRNPRGTHSKVDRQVVEIGKPFDNGLLHPHQIGAPVEEVVNCNCVARPKVDL